MVSEVEHFSRGFPPFEPSWLFCFAIFSITSLQKRKNVEINLAQFFRSVKLLAQIAVRFLKICHIYWDKSTGWYVKFSVFPIMIWRINAGNFSRDDVIWVIIIVVRFEIHFLRNKRSVIHYDSLSMQNANAHIRSNNYISHSYWRSINEGVDGTAPL